MQKQMKSCRPIFRRTAVLVLAGCLAMGNAGVPVLAEEKISGQRPKEDGIDIDQETKEQKLNGTDADQETKEQNPDGTDAGQEEREQNPDGTDAGQETEEQNPDGTGTDQKEEGQDPDRTDVDQEVEEQKPGKGAADDIKKEVSEDEKKETVSGNTIDHKEEIFEDREEKGKAESINVVVPAAYTLALNPYRLPVMTGEEEITTDQIISGTYGMVNKSSTDQIVTVTLLVEDYSGEELVFVDSAEEAEHAGMNVYAIYLAAVPAGGEPILIDGEPVDKTVTGESLQNVKMTGAPDRAVTLYAGTNQMSFQLSKAVYHSELAEEPGEGNLDAEEEDTSESKEQPENVLKELDPDGKSVTAYTFTGVMNPNAEWEKLSGGIKLSVVYTYRAADGDEEIIEGTGAMVSGTGIKDPA